MNPLDQVAYQFIDIKTDSFYVCFDDTCAVPEWFGHARLLILSVASPLSVRLALFLKHNLLNHVVVGILVHSVAPYVSLSYVRVIFLNRSRCCVHRRLRKSEDHGQVSLEDQVIHVASLTTCTW